MKIIMNEGTTRTRTIKENKSRAIVKALTTAEDVLNSYLDGQVDLSVDESGSSITYTTDGINPQSIKVVKRTVPVYDIIDSIGDKVGTYDSVDNLTNAVVQLILDDVDNVREEDTHLNEDIRDVYASKIFRPFNEYDWYGLAGANKFPDGHEPLIAETDLAQIVISPTDEGNKLDLQVLCYAEDGPKSEEAVFDQEFPFEDLSSISDIIHAGEDLYNDIKRFDKYESFDDLCNYLESDGFNRIL